MNKRFLFISRKLIVVGEFGTPTAETAGKLQQRIDQLEVPTFLSETHQLHGVKTLIEKKISDCNREILGESDSPSFANVTYQYQRFSDELDFIVKTLKLVVLPADEAE